MLTRVSEKIHWDVFSSEYLRVLYKDVSMMFEIVLRNVCWQDCQNHLKNNISQYLLKMLTRFSGKFIENVLAVNIWRVLYKDVSNDVWDSS